MNNVTLHMNTSTDFTLVSNAFIDTFLPQANGEFVKVYLYLLRCVSGHFNNLSVSAAADILNQTEADIMRAIRYWDKAGVISMEYDSTGQNLAGITFIAPNTYAPANDAPVLKPTAVPSPAPAINPSAINNRAAATSTDTNSFAPKASAAGTKEDYTPSKIAEFSSQEDFAMLLYAVGAYLGGTLSPANAQVIAYIYDSLHFSCELIEFLVEYCVSNGHKSMRYIEKTALNWAEAGITTVKEAKLETSNHNTITYSILNAFGISGRNPGQREKDYISKWTDVYCFDSDIIIEACNRTLKVTHQPSFEYADSILSKWNSANVKTAADIRKADAEYELLRNKKNTKANSQISSNASGNRFNNFQQRDTNIDDLESALLSNNLK